MVGKEREADIVVGDALAVGGVLLLALHEAVELDRHCGLAVTEHALRRQVFGAEPAFLERLEVGEFLELRAGIDEGLREEAFVGRSRRW